MKYFIALALILAPAAAQAVKETTYEHPKDLFSGLPMDHCLYSARECGQSSAQKYCESMNAGDAESFQWEHSNAGTYVQGTKTHATSRNSTSATR